MAARWSHQWPVPSGELSSITSTSTSGSGRENLVHQTRQVLDFVVRGQRDQCGWAGALMMSLRAVQLFERAKSRVAAVRLACCPSIRWSPGRTGASGRLSSLSAAVAAIYNLAFPARRGTIHRLPAENGCVTPKRGRSGPFQSGACRCRDRQGAGRRTAAPSGAPTSATRPS